MAGVLLASSEFGNVRNTLNGVQLSNPVGARDIRARDESESKCIATRYASVMGFDTKGNSTGVWVLEGNPTNHRKFDEVYKRRPNASAAEIVELSGGIFHEHCRSLGLRLCNLLAN